MNVFFREICRLSNVVLLLFTGRIRSTAELESSLERNLAWRASVLDRFEQECAELNSRRGPVGLPDPVIRGGQ